MTAASYLSIVFYVVSLAMALAVGRGALKSKTIQTQAEYITALEKDRNFYKEQYEVVKKQNADQEQRIRFLEEMLLRGNPSMVQEGPPMGPRRKRRGNRPDPPETGKDG